MQLRQTSPPQPPKSDRSLFVAIAPFVSVLVDTLALPRRGRGGCTGAGALQAREKVLLERHRLFKRIQKSALKCAFLCQRINIQQLPFREGKFKISDRSCTPERSPREPSIFALSQFYPQLIDGSQFFSVRLMGMIISALALCLIFRERCLSETTNEKCLLGLTIFRQKNSLVSRQIN